MYYTACASSDLLFKTMMLWTLEKVNPSYPTRVVQWWSEGWHLSGGYFDIRVDHIMNLSMDLHRLRWFEELGQVRLCMFLPTRVDKMVTIGGMRMSQNQWIYREATRIVSTNRIALFDRYYNRLSDLEFEYGLPRLPDTYRILENLTVPFQWIDMEAMKFHGIQMG